MTRKVNYKLYLLIFSLIFTISTVAAQNTSVFADDTCTAPCWFGLIAGESTTNDVEQFIADHELADVEIYGLLDEETQRLITGVYEFTFLERETSTVFVEIQIRDSIIYTIILYPTDFQIQLCLMNISPCNKHSTNLVNQIVFIPILAAHYSATNSI